MIKVSVDIVCNNVDNLKPLAFLIMVKQHYATSVVPDFSYYKLAKQFNIHHATIKKYINKLWEMGLLEFVGKKQKNLLFKKVRGERNFNLAKIKSDSFKDIVRGLQSFCIANLQNQNDYVQQRVRQAQRSDDKIFSKKQRKAQIKAQNLCDERGWYSSSDYGISYNTIKKKTKMSKNTISKALKFAKEKNILSINKNVEQIYMKDAKNKMAGNYDRVIFHNDKICNYTFCTKNNIYIVKANSYKVSPNVLV